MTEQPEDFRRTYPFLVDAFSGVVCVHVDVLGAEVAPLESVDGAEVALLAVAQADRVQKRS